MLLKVCNQLATDADRQAAGDATLLKAAMLIGHEPGVRGHLLQIDRAAVDGSPNELDSPCEARCQQGVPDGWCAHLSNVAGQEGPSDCAVNPYKVLILADVHLDFALAKEHLAHVPKLKATPYRQVFGVGRQVWQSNGGELAILIKPMINDYHIARCVFRFDNVFEEELQVADCFRVSVSVTVDYQGRGRWMYVIADAAPIQS